MRTVAMPADTNSNGDVFGGWLISQMDFGAGMMARDIARSRVVTVAVEAMSFVAPVNVGDAVTCYAELLSVGRTSMRISIEAWVSHYSHDLPRRVTEGIFTYVAIDAQGRPQPVKREG
jgi:acyl-CoA thioesterase YciA